MREAALRYAIILMLVVAMGAVALTLGRAASGKSDDSAYSKFQRGGLSALDVSSAGQTAGAAVFVGPGGSDAALADFAGGPILVNYWATWCAPCERELPSLGALQTARPDLRVLAISVDSEDDGAYARRRLSELTGGVLAFYHAPDYGPVYEAGVRGFPTTIAYDSGGVELFRLAGEADWASYEALALVDAVLAER